MNEATENHQHTANASLTKPLTIPNKLHRRSTRQHLAFYLTLAAICLALRPYIIIHFKVIQICCQVKTMI